MGIVTKSLLTATAALALLAPAGRGLAADEAVGEALAEATTEAAAQSAAPEAEAPKPAADMVSDGNRVTVKEGDFSIVPPRGWEVYTHLPSLTLLMQVPHQAGQKYQRTIQVAAFSGPRYVDEVTAREYEDIIVRKFSQATTSVEGYRIRNHMVIEMADGRDGLLFYTEFQIGGVPLMQAHVLVSSQTRHYLMTYTDVAEHFENDAASQFLTEAWDSMISVQLATRTPTRFESALFIGGGGLALLFLGATWMVFRRWRSGRQYREYAEGRGLGDVDVKTNAPKSIATSDFNSLASIQTSVQTSVQTNQGNSSLHSIAEAPRKKASGKNVPGKAISGKRASGKGEEAQPSLAENGGDEPFDTQEDVAI
jgi:hypothetical protein